ncbi:protease inhibitor I42 family protein [Nonomuraea sp. NPDC050556]|uniref:protease inhibitor I42 family protein n=1 Tax=Nonomuraea sp. NPDC050556 TaxID=3364369 RepID=UPI0037A9B3A5
MRRQLLVLALVLPLAGACSPGSAVNNYGKVVQGTKGTTVQVEVAKGQRFSLAVPDNASIGDSWELVAVPDAKVASFISKEHEQKSDAPGAGGTSYFVFNAKQPGSTEVKLFDCYRCGTAKTTPESGEAIFEITVK